MSDRPTDRLIAELLDVPTEDVERTGKRIRSTMDDLVDEYPETPQGAAVSSESALWALKSAKVSTVANGTVIRVDLDDAASPGAALLHVLDYIDVVDMVAGKYRKTDAQLRLTVRGQIPGGSMVVAVGAFNEPRQIELIQSQIERQRCRELVTRIAEIEKGY